MAHNAWAQEARNGGSLRHVASYSADRNDADESQTTGAQSVNGAAAPHFHDGYLTPAQSPIIQQFEEARQNFMNDLALGEPGGGVASERGQSRASFKQIGQKISSKFARGKLSPGFASKSESALSSGNCSDPRVPEMPAPLSVMTDGRSRNKKLDSPVILSAGSTTPKNFGSLTPAGRVRVEQAMARVPSHHALIVDPESGIPTTRYEHVTAPDTPSVYSERGIWANDPRVGVSLPPFSPMPAANAKKSHGSSSSSECRTPGMTESSFGEPYKTSPKALAVTEQTLTKLFAELKAYQDDRFDRLLRHFDERIDKMEQTFVARCDSLDKAIKRVDAHALEFAQEAKDERNHIKDDMFQLGQDVNQEFGHLDSNLHAVEECLVSVTSRLETIELSNTRRQVTTSRPSRRPSTRTTRDGSPTRIAAGPSNVASLANMFSTMGVNIEPRAPPMPAMSNEHERAITPAPIESTVPRPTIEGPNGVFYEMPDAMLISRVERDNADGEDGHEER